ncbi:hypothetical protein K7X08_032389 [Anisodus acutangulus]|uniref:Uncharacterized protein n=1 Tax=Anisodus acutangulus TaxID=402998 RepID=A0A9Q1RA74_9SOLA|nr:hypothetical protein K7X08_032389 [Anisodus acutangulus]
MARPKLKNNVPGKENVDADDEAEIEQEYEKSDDRDESDNEIEESNGGADHMNDGIKEGDGVDVGDGVGTFGSIDVEGVSAVGVGSSRHTTDCSHCVHDSPTLNKVLEDVANIRVANDTMLQRLEHHGKSNVKEGGIHE